jgi:outer membrane immunogenic protein
MKTVIAASLALIASTYAVLAADTEPTISPGPFAPPPAFPARATAGPVVTPGPFDPPPAYPTARIYNWTGFYVGLNAGGAFGSTHWTSVPDVTSGNSNLSGVLVGGTAGYNLQTGEPYVLGVEADLDWTSIKGSASPASCASTCDVTSPWLSTIRLRFGYAFDGILPYLTGGVAIADLNAYSVGSPFGTEMATNLGWTAGAGIEFVIAGGWRAKVEYLYVDLNGFTCNAACRGGPISFNINESIVRVGLNYRLWMN